MRDVTTIAEDIPTAINHLRSGRHADAEVVCRRLIQRDPSDAAAMHVLGLACRDDGRYEEALHWLSRAAEVAPQDPEVHANLGVLLGESKRHEEAAAHFRAAARLRPNYAEAWYNLGIALEKSDKPAEAEEAFGRAVSLRPDHADALLHQSTLLRKLGRPAVAVAACRKVIQLRPREPDAHRALGDALVEQGRYKAAGGAFRHAAILDPGLFAAGSDYLHLLLYDPANSADQVFGEAKRWAARHAAPLAREAFTHKNDPDPDRVLRVGYVSGDFRDHPVARLMVPVLANLDRSAFEVFCYHDSPRGDPVTERLRSFPATWRDTQDMSDDAIAAQVRADRIDILVDLGGHMCPRLLVFARRPAPVQVTHFNYPATTGMAAVAWRISDPLSEPDDGEADRYSVERLCRLPNCAWCYDPGEDVPDVGQLPALSHGYLTFTSLNKPLKHTPQAAELWSRILKAVPGSKLLLRGFADYDENAALAELFAPHGVLDRLIFAGKAPRPGYLGLYNRADIAIDPFPYNGGVTSADALYMGVPLIALTGGSYRARQGLMLLTNLGLPELIASTSDEYVQIAVQLANDLPRLTALRAQLRERMLRSAIMDGPEFAKALGDAFKVMWRDWCSRQRPLPALVAR